MRVLILSQYYKPEPILKPTELAQELQKQGHQASVLTGLPNYPSGTLYPGFRLGLVQREEIDGIRVTRTFEFPYHGKRGLGRILNYLSFMLSAPVGSLFVPRCDVIYVWHPPLTIGVAAWIVARLRRVPFVYDVQDIWPESAVLAGILREGGLVSMMSWLERFVYRQADHILVVTRGARDNLVSKGVPPQKISIMPHWTDERVFGQSSQEDRSAVREQYGWQDRFVILFAGNLGMVQGLDTVLGAADQLGNEQFLMVLLGDGSDKARLQSLARSLRLADRVQFIEHQPLDRMPAFMSAADALLVHLKRSDLSRYVVPTKTLAYLAASRPIIMAMDGAAADLVREARAGLVVPPESADALAGAIRSLHHMPVADRMAMGARGREYLLAHLTKTHVISLYETILKEAVARKAG